MSISLEKGLFRLTELSIASDADFRRQAKNENFYAADRHMFDEYRLYRLQKTLKYVYENSRHYRKAFDECGIKPEDIVSIEDLKKLPFTNPEDITADNFAFLCISQAEVEKAVTYYSTGTTGPRKRFFYSESDEDDIRLFLGAGMNTVTDPGNAVQIVLPNFNGRGIGTLLMDGCRQRGFNAYTCDMTLDAEEQIKATLKNHPSVWFGDTNTIYRTTKEMEKKYDLKSLGVEVLFCTIGQPSAVMVKNLEKAWNCRVSTHYGLTEVGWGFAVDCESGSGYHFNEYNVIAEVVDPETGKPVPDGEEGELVFTSISREAMPLIRYRSRDIGSISSKPCSCGGGMQTMSHIKRRIDTTLQLDGGYEIYPSMFDDYLYCFDEVIDYRMYIDRKGEQPKLLFNVEVTEDKDLAERISGSVMNIDIVKRCCREAEVKLLPEGALKKDIFAKKQIQEI